MSLVDAEWRRRAQRISDSIKNIVKGIPGTGCPNEYLIQICEPLWKLANRLDDLTDIDREDSFKFAHCLSVLKRSSDGLKADPEEMPDGAEGVVAAGDIASLVDRHLNSPLPRGQSPYPWIKDRKLRGIVERDVAEALSCFDSGNWMACQALCGCVVEAVLLDWFRRKGGEWFKTYAKVPKHLEGRRDGIMDDKSRDWMLSNLVKVARRSRILSKGGGIPEWFPLSRNLVHPAVERRGAVEVSESMARRSVAEMLRVLDVLSKRKWP